MWHTCSDRQFGTQMRFCYTVGAMKNGYGSFIFVHERGVELKKTLSFFVMNRGIDGCFCHLFVLWWSVALTDVSLFPRACWVGAWH